MNIRLASAALVAALHVAQAYSQDAPPAKHEHHPGKMAAPAAKAMARPAAKAAMPSAPAGGYRSPFADYRPFRMDEPAKDWRRANDEVRDAGGHVGLMKPDTKK